ncbi:MAG: nitrite reductase [Sporomusaceae bacterium]|nr:nitrite reductase [Sporomusaceae bacterium]
MNRKISLAPHLPGGRITAEQMKHVVGIAEKYGASLRLTASTIVLSGIDPQDREAAVEELKMPLESFMAKAVRAIAMCTGKPSCPRGQQETMTLGLALDERFFGQPTPAKIRIGLSGCSNCCSEPLVKDIGLFGAPKGFMLAIGGQAGSRVQAGKVIALNLPGEAVPEVIQAILDYYRRYGRDKERLGAMIERIGLEEVAFAVIPKAFQMPVLAK